MTILGVDGHSFLTPTVADVLSAAVPRPPSLWPLLVSYQDYSHRWQTYVTHRWQTYVTHRWQTYVTHWWQTYVTHRWQTYVTHWWQTYVTHRWQTYVTHRWQTYVTHWWQTYVTHRWQTYVTHRWQTYVTHWWQTYVTHWWQTYVTHRWQTYVTHRWQTYVTHWWQTYVTHRWQTYVTHWKSWSTRHCCQEDQHSLLTVCDTEGCRCVVTPRAVRTYRCVDVSVSLQVASHRCCCGEIKSIRVWHRSFSALSSTTSSINHVVAGFADHAMPSFDDHVMGSIEHHVLAGSEDQLNVTQHSTIQYSTVQYSTVQYSTVQYSTVQYSTVQYSTVQYSTVQYSTVQYSTVQYKMLIPTLRNCSLAVLTGSEDHVETSFRDQRQALGSYCGKIEGSSCGKLRGLYCGSLSRSYCAGSEDHIVVGFGITPCHTRSYCSMTMEHVMAAFTSHAVVNCGKGNGVFNFFLNERNQTWIKPHFHHFRLLSELHAWCNSGSLLYWDIVNEWRVLG